MTLSLLAHAALRPYLKELLPLCPHRAEVSYLSDSPALRQIQISRHLEGDTGFDAHLLLDGTDLIPEDGWQIDETPLILPRVHNLIALLLGDASVFRRIHDLYDGGVCWLLPGMSHEFFLTPPEDCQAICVLNDTQFLLPDLSLHGQMIARYHNWDFMQVSSNLTLLETLLCGGWSNNDFIIAQAGSLLLPHESSCVRQATTV